MRWPFILLLAWVVLVFAIVARLWWVVRHDAVTLDPEFQPTHPFNNPPEQ